MKKEFIDYNNTIQKIRKSIVKECSEIIKADSIIFVTEEDEVSIVVVGDCYAPEVVMEIEKRGDTIIILTEDESETDLADLETDDMVAIYEYLYSIFINNTKN
jgi:hypothetical protein